MNNGGVTSGNGINGNVTEHLKINTDKSITEELLPICSTEEKEESNNSNNPNNNINKNLSHGLPGKHVNMF